MRRLLCSSVCVLFLAVPGLRADDQSEAMAFVDKAIKAAGGEAKLAKLHTITWKGKGKVEENNMEVAMAMDGTIQGHDQVKMDVEITVMGMTMKGTMVFNKDKGWFKEGANNAKEAPPEAPPILKQIFYAMRTPQQLVTLKDKSHKLAPLGESKVNDKPAYGVRVTREGYADLSLYFDKESSLPAKVETRIKDPTGQEVPIEFVLSEFKESEGVKHFTKITLVTTEPGGKKVNVVLELSEVKAVDKLDDGTFAMP